MTEPISFGARLGQLAAERPDDPALVLARADGSEESLTFAEFDRWSNRVAHMLADKGVGLGTSIVVCYPNSLEHVVATWAGWKCGALVLPLNVKAAPREREEMIELIGPTVVLAEWSITREALHQLDAYSDEPLPDVIPHPGKCVGSGGSTGRSKIIVNPNPWAKVPGDSLGAPGRYVRFPEIRVQLVPGPLYHNMPFSWTQFGLFEGQQVVVMERFDAGRLVDLVEQHRVEYMTVVPTMMRRVAELPDVRQRDWSSIKSILHSAAACPEPVKRAWIEMLGPEKVFEGFGATEDNGIVIIRGDEWLEHPGSVGRPFDGSAVRVLDENGNEVPPGTVGEIFMGLEQAVETYRYIGSEPAKSTSDGLVSVGDMGWVDEEGWLYCADRRADLIITGGSNVYPKEVEHALLEHPAVADAVVIGVPDEEWGKRVHAIIQPRGPDALPDPRDLQAHCRARLAPYKVPKSIEFVDDFPRDEAGKIRRSKLAAERAEALAVTERS